MVSAGNHEPRIGNPCDYEIERFDHEFKALVGSPFSEGQNRGVLAARKIRKFWTPGENAVRA